MHSGKDSSVRDASGPCFRSIGAQRLDTRGLIGFLGVRHALVIVDNEAIGFGSGFLLFHDEPPWGEIECKANCRAYRQER